MVRRRLQEGQDLNNDNKNNASDKTKEEQVRELLDEEKQHEGLAQELLRLTGSLKQNFTTAGSVLKEDNAALDVMHRIASSNKENLVRESGQMCPNTLRFLRNFPNVCVTQHCPFSAKEAAIALRPFYFAVHPDRFAQEPDIQTRNERALQVFNGYINNLFPEPVTQMPVNVEFTVRDTLSNFKSIRIFLSGADPAEIIKLALERCDLSTAHLPVRDNPSQNQKIGIKTSQQNFAPGLDEIWKNLQENERLRQKRFYAVNLLKELSKNRELAMQRRDGHKVMVEIIEDNIDEIKRKTGLTQILWSINWELTFMRRCLINVLEMINHADKCSKDFIIYSLNGRQLTFGRGSHICCNGSLQFGADDAIEKIFLILSWFEVQNLERLVERVAELLGGINLLVQPHDGLLQTIKNVKLFIARICSQPPSELSKINSLLKKDQQVQIMNGYSELALLRGILQIPCNVDIQALKHFIDKNDASKAEKMRKEYFEQKYFLESVKNSTVSHLELTSLSWDADLNFSRLLDALRKLSKIQKEQISHFSGLEIHLGSGPKIFVLASGKISVPIEMIEDFEI
uniref:T-cell activation inhibitor, mitochondrial n=1 Tax=Meloidogyne javanica TaxID=6303 RepID=A0A915N5E1_MELJA